MKKVRISILKKYNATIAVLLSLLGFACSGNNDDEPLLDEYGCPYATFIVNGNVTSASSSEAISNIQVIMGYDTTYTDETGNYEVEQDAIPEDTTFIVEFKDIDGSDNGEFSDRDTTLIFTDPEFSNGDGWYEGSTSKTINIELEDKE